MGVCQNAAMRRAHLILALLVALCAAGTHLRALSADLLFDDRALIRENARLHVQSLSAWGELLTSGWWEGEGHDLLWRPLTMATFAVQTTWGAGPRALHAVNLLLHAAVTVLVFFLALGMPAAGRASPMRLGTALGAALLFGVHPLASEAVTLVVGRADLLVALATLGTLLALRRWRWQSRRPRLLALAAILTAAACLAKENGFVMPLLALMALAPWARPVDTQAPAGGRLRAWRESWPAMVAVLLPAALVLILRVSILGGLMRLQAAPLGDNPIAHAGFWAGRLTALRLLASGGWLFLWPHPLSVDYSYAAVTVPDVDGPLLASTLAGLGALALLLVLLRRLPAACWGVLFFLAAQALTANLLVPIGTVFAERLLYLPMAGLAMAVAALGATVMAAASAASRPVLLRVLLPGMALLILSLLAATTLHRERDFAHDLSLWRATVAAVPTSAKARYNHARSLSAHGRDHEAAAEYRQVLSILADKVEANARQHVEAATNLAGIELRRGNPAAALLLLEQAAVLRPEVAEIAFRQALALEQLGRSGEAMAAFRRGAHLAPQTALRLAADGDPWRRWLSESASPPLPPPPAGD